MKTFSIIVSLIILMINCSNNMKNSDKNTISNLDTATFGAGCFWCVEAVFQRLNGVESVTSGYSGGHDENPDYRKVCNGVTGHAEVCQIVYDPEIITYEELLEVFWKTHDPTTLNRQGNDIGTQYRSIILAHSNKQFDLAKKYKDKLNKEMIFGKPVVTEIIMFEKFYIAEDSHQDYYNQNKTQPYCNFTITPKIEKLNKIFKEKIKED